MLDKYCCIELFYDSHDIQLPYATCNLLPSGTDESESSSGTDYKSSDTDDPECPFTVPPTTPETSMIVFQQAASPNFIGPQVCKTVILS